MRKKPANSRAKKLFVLPTERSKPVLDPWQYAFLVTGEKKIGKTSFAIEGCEEYVIQFDKPQLSYNIRETLVDSWNKFLKILKALEAAVENDEFPYTRIVIDGTGEWYTMCQVAACKVFQVDHPSEVGYARCWHWIRDNFLDAVNRLLRLQISAKCGLIFIAHSEWKEVMTRSGVKIDRMVPNLPSKCEEIVNGKVDGWFTYDYIGEKRIMIILGDETTGAGHRIDGRFRTPDGEAVREIYMGESSKSAQENFLKAFNNKQTYTTYKELRKKNRTKTPTRRRKGSEK